MTQPSIGLLDAGGKLVAWGYIGVDGSFATLYVLPEERGKGFATYVAVELLRRLHDGGFKGIGFSGDSGWVHSHVYDGNRESEGVMKRLGGKIYTVDSYTWVDSDKF
jgi:GNAT superfamily N-acetyltransferase